VDEDLARKDVLSDENVLKWISTVFARRRLRCVVDEIGGPAIVDLDR
jgi:hypothetical protein